MAGLFYSDGRIGIASGVLRSATFILSDVSSALSIDDAEKAAALAGDITAVEAEIASVASLDDIGFLASRLLTLTRDLGRASQNPDSAASVWKAAQSRCASLQATSLSVAVTRASGLGNAVAALIEAACLGEYAVALSQGSFVDRRSALDAKASLDVDSAGALGRIASVCGEDIWSAASQAIGHAADYLSARALDLRPIIFVSAPVSLPATAVAWALYGDPQRAAEVVARNRVGTPALMPLSFEALAP
jgi:prophage DNA circulation protein